MEKNNSIREITIKIEGDSWKKAIEKAYQKASKKVKIDGFRPGKAPKSVFMKKYGVESLFFDASEYCIEEAYKKILDENKDIEIVAQPSVDIKSVDENYIEYVFKLTLKPEFKLGKYKKLDVKKEKVTVTKDEIKEAIDKTREQYKENIVKEGTLENGDIAIIDFEGFKDGVAFEGGKGENYSLEIGSGSFIPGFEEGVIGMKVGDEKDLDLTFPEDYGVEDLAGAKVVFKVKVNEIKQKQTRELDKDFFDDLGMEGIDTEEKLKDEIKASIQAQKEMDAENAYIDKILEEVSKNVEVEIPEEMVEDEIDHLMEHFEQQIKMQGLSLDLYYQFTGSDEKALRSQMEKEAYKNVLYRFMLEEVGILEKVEVTLEEAEKEAENLAQKYQMKKEDFLEKMGGLDLIQYDLKMHKTIDLLKELNK